MYLSWEAFLLGPIFKERDWNDSPFNVYPAKGRSMWRDLERLCDGYGLPFARPTRFPRGSLLAARTACLASAASEPWLPDFCRADFRANFAEDREIGDPEEVRAILDSLDLPGPAGTRARRAGGDAREQATPALTDQPGRRARHLRRPQLRRRRGTLLGQRPPGACREVGKLQEGLRRRPRPERRRGPASDPLPKNLRLAPSRLWGDASCSVEPPGQSFVA
jgi:hypothetical protein